MYTNDNFYPHSFPIPYHIAIIPDGGRRWATEHNVRYKDSYKISIQKIRELLEQLYVYGTQCISIYCASTQNFLRSEYEVKSFCDAGWEGIIDELVPFAISQNISIEVVGRKDINSSNFEDRIKYAEQQTAFPNARKLFVCFNYNSLDEIESAFKKRNKGDDSFVNYLDVSYPVDILIRTGGAKTLSGFLLPQLAFARLFFLDKLFNDITFSDIKEILSIYANYNLKYGE